MIEATGIQKVYAAGGLRVLALRGVDLGVGRGEMVAIMGPSGSGKTTLLNVLSGLDDLSDGEVYVDGESIKGMSDRRRTRFRVEKMGFIFQSYNLIPVLSAIENIELPLLVAGRKPKKARQWAQDTLEMVGLGRRRATSSVWQTGWIRRLSRKTWRKPSPRTAFRPSR